MSRTWGEKPAPWPSDPPGSRAPPGPLTCRSLPADRDTGPSMPRALLSLAAVLLLSVVASPAARADEVFVLDNGMVLRGTAVAQNENGVVIRLADFVEDARVTVAPARIVKRYDTRGWRATSGARGPMAFATDAPAAADAGDTPAPYTGRPWNSAVVESAPLDEPSAVHETFFARLRRLGLMALPSDTLSRVTLAVLLCAALLALSLLGGRLLEIEGLGPIPAVLLSAAFGSMVLADTLYSDLLLRADRALWVLPGQALAFVGLAWGTLRCELGRAVLLLAFMGFSLAVLVFAAGAVLMAC